MGEIINNKFFNAILLITIIGEFLIPWILKHFYKEYNSKTMVMSVLGSPQSPVRLIYNIWLIWLGLFLVFTAVIYFFSAVNISLILSFMLLLSIGIFAIGAGILSGLFSVNESKEKVTLASKIHGAGAAIGFMTLLFFPLINSILEFKQTDMGFGIVCIVAFVLAMGSFMFFVMGDKEQFKNTILSYEGLWERVTLFFMYVPFIYRTVEILICT